MSERRNKISLLILLMILMSSCGDLFMKKNEEEVDLTPFATCTIDTQALSKIFTENIEGDLVCLEMNLNLFIKIVKTDRPGYLSFQKLKSYIRTHISGISTETMNALSAIFDINSLLLGDDPLYIHQENVGKLTDLFIEINKIFITNKIYEYYTAKDFPSFTEHGRRKAQIYHALKKLSNKLSKVYRDNDNELNIKDFIHKFDSDKTGELLDRVRSVLFLKKMILGKSPDVFTAKEFNRLTMILADVGKVLFDITNLPKTNGHHTEDEAVLKTYKDGFETLRKHFIHTKYSNETMFTYEDLANVVAKFFPEYMNYLTYEKDILKLKEVFLDDNSENFSAKEVHKIIDNYIVRLLDKSLFFYRAYFSNVKLIKSEEKILRVPYIPYFLGEWDKSFILDFNRIVERYRFMLGSSYLPSYTPEYSRNVRGIVEIGIIEELITKFFEAFGTKDDSVVGRYYMTQDSIINFMTKFSNFFEGEGYIAPGRAIGVSSTITLVTSLFQAQSNGDSKVEIPEFTEFVVSMLSSLKLSKDFFAFIKDKCEFDDRGRVTQKCVNENYIGFFNSEKGDEDFSEIFPGLKNFIEELETEERNKYFDDAAKFSRTCTHFADGSEVPVSQSEMIILWAGLLNIEQSFLRFDEPSEGTVRTADNILDDAEVRATYPVFEAAVKGMIPVKFLKKFSRQIFYYLVVNKKVPNFDEIESISDLKRVLGGAFSLGGFIFGRYVEKYTPFASLEMQADRMTFSAVLRLIQENIPPSGPEFDCETLR